MAEKKIRMATSDDPREQGHTIVGGRPSGNRSQGSGIPRALEILVKKAAVDEDFRNELLEKRDKLADELSVPLDASERAMLSCVPAEHLQQMISHTQVPETQKRHLIGASAAAIVALITQLTFAPAPANAQQKIVNQPAAVRRSEMPDIKEDFYAGLGGIRPDLADRGARPDMPHYEDDFDEELVPQMSRPVHPADPVIINGLAPHYIVKNNVRGLRFFEAINALADESEIMIEFENLSANYEHRQVVAHIEGLDLKEALLDICSEYVDADKQCIIHFINDENRIFIEFIDYTESKAPLLPADFDFGKDRDDGPQIVRGIRSDFPREKIPEPQSPRLRRDTPADEGNDSDPFDLKLRDKK
jgi:hypothetical protein